MTPGLPPLKARFYNEIATKIAMDRAEIVGVGTTFTIVLPRVADAAVTSDSSPAALAVPTGSETVLVAEDEAALWLAGRLAQEAKLNADAVTNLGIYCALSAIAGAKVTLANEDTGVSRTVTTNTAGAFSFPDLPVGSYRVEVEAPGFKTFVQTKVLINVADVREVNAKLETGAVTETVSVEANPNAVKTVGAEIAGLVSGEQVRELPLNGRNFEYLGEDPFLASRMVVGYIRGVQSQGVMATVKHYAVNNVEQGRQSLSAAVSERMRVTHSPA